MPDYRPRRRVWYPRLRMYGEIVALSTDLPLQAWVDWDDGGRTWIPMEDLKVVET